MRFFGQLGFYSIIYFPGRSTKESDSVQFSCSVMSDSLWPHGPQHSRPPCPSPSLGVHPNSCPSSQWGHPTISPTVVPFSSCLHSFPESGSFTMSVTPLLFAKYRVDLRQRWHGNIVWFPKLRTFTYFLLCGGSGNLQDIWRRNYHLNKEPARENGYVHRHYLWGLRPGFLSIHSFNKRKLRA